MQNENGYVYLAKQRIDLLYDLIIGAPDEISTEENANLNGELAAGIAKIDARNNVTIAKKKKIGTAQKLATVLSSIQATEDVVDCDKYLKGSMNTKQEPSPNMTWRLPTAMQNTC